MFATGFRYSFPFLSQYHNSSIGVNDTAPPGTLQPIITDGSHVRSLYMDTFYIDDPTLAFMNSVYWDLVFIFFGVHSLSSEYRNANVHLLGVSFNRYGKSLVWKG